MQDLLNLIRWTLLVLFRSKSSLEAEILALRHQLNVLRRTSSRRPFFSNFDRMIFVCLYRIAPRILDVLTIVEPETVIRWHRAGFRSWAEGKEYLAWLAGRGGPEPAEYGMLKNLFDAVHAKEFKIVDGTSVPPSEASSLDPVLDQHRAVFRSTASMQGFSYVKPYGYAGDFEIIERICKSAVSSISNITRWDKFFHEGDAPRAVRNRSSLLATLIREARPESILSAGSGPSLDLAEVLKTDESLKEIEILDNDPNAVARSKVNIAAVEHYLCRSFGFNVRNVLRFKPTRTYGFVWCSGLFDYLNDKTAVFLLKRFNEMLEPGGTLAFGNFGQENGSRSYMEIVGRWFLIYRSPMDLMRLAATSGFLPRKTRVCTDATGLNNFLITTKAT